MVARIVIAWNQPRTLFQPGRYEVVLEPAGNLQPDEAIFVTSSKLESESGVGLDQVNALRSSLKDFIRDRARNRGLVFIGDVERKGVWIYRTMWAPGNGRAIGPAKEEEIRSRPVDQ